MYTGTQKKAVVFKPGANSVIEEAYFILKDNLPSVKESEMIREANRILKTNIVGGYFFEAEKNTQPPAKKHNLTSFLLGALLSFILCTVIFLLIN